MTAVTTQSTTKTRDMVYIAMFAVLISICSWISIPSAVPFTMQTFGIFLAVAVLGGKRGSLAVLVYLLLGLVGVPVFAGFSGGIGCLAGTTGGYIVGFQLTALVMWAMEVMLGKKTFVLFASMVLGTAACYAFGTVWFMYVYARTTGAIGLGTALGWCVIPYIIPDLLKAALALALRGRLCRAIRIG